MLNQSDLDSRFSPACAGRGRRRRRSPWRGPVQPRVCGERRAKRAAKLYAVGSAPRVRGEARRFAREQTLTRFSPACAGRGRRVSRCAWTRSVQPRVCGERERDQREDYRAAGSAPRVRGEGPIQAAALAGLRFSPACAGRGSVWPRLARARAVQPRVCGERSASWAITSARDGSAPRVRGEGRAGASPTWARRFSPACAGRGFRATSYGPSPSVQPRVCGERRRRGRVEPARLGSAPRVRGEASRPRAP